LVKIAGSLRCCNQGGCCRRSRKPQCCAADDVKQLFALPDKRAWHNGRVLIFETKIPTNWFPHRSDTTQCSSSTLIQRSPYCMRASLSYCSVSTAHNDPLRVLLLTTEQYDTSGLQVASTNLYMHTLSFSPIVKLHKAVIPLKCSVLILTTLL
jgi:hypothetical protein